MNAPKFPLDEFNQNLIQDVFPSNWKNPKPADIYDLVVLGGGPGGMTAVTMAAKLNAKTAIVEKEHLGGECLNVGCIPSKTLLRSSRLCAEVRDAADFGIEIGKGWRVNFPSVMQRVRRLRSALSPHDSALHFKALGTDVFLGMGHFTGSDKLEVAGQTLRFKKAIVATGTQPIRLAVQGLEEAGYLTNQTVFNLTFLPARLAVIGAGPIGCELSQAFARFGSKVLLITRGSSLLPKDDRTATERLQKVMEKEGMQVLFQSQLQRVEMKGKEKILYLDRSSKGIAVDEILVATGRIPVVEELALDRAGVIFDAKNGIAANEFLQTSNPDIYAVGDVTSRYKFTHISMELGKIAVQNALNSGNIKHSSLIIPWCTYTDPEIAHIGLLEKEVLANENALLTQLIELKDTDRALLDGETVGFVKIHLQKGTEQIVGATIMARHAGDMISEIAVAMKSGKGITALAGAIHPFPTQAEAIRGAATALITTMPKKDSISFKETA
jgi:pyruvate/2-oxoglutarate dehydrogenase complex dihydrolipoamide dehydrogenase (E3) component